MIDLLARQTDGSLFFLKTEDAVRKANRRISAISRELSKQPPDCGLIVPCAFHENVTKALNAARTTLAMYIVEYDVYRDLLLKQGFKEVDKIAAAGRSGLEDASKLVDDSMVGALTLCGTKYDIGKQMKKFEQAGVHLIVLEPCFFEGEKLSDTIHRTIELNG